MLDTAQGQGQSMRLGFAFSPAPASPPAARDPKGSGTWADVQCPQDRCAPAPGLPPGSCYCRYQAGGGSLTRSPQVRQAGLEGEQPCQAGRSWGRSARPWPNAPGPLQGALSGLAVAAAARGRCYCLCPTSPSPAWQVAVGTSQGCQGSCQLGRAREGDTAAGMRTGQGALTPPSLKAVLQETVGSKHTLMG